MTSLCWPFPQKNAAQYRRIDQGWDLQTAPGTPVLAVAAGVIDYAHDPGTNGGHFGDPYPILTLDEADANGPVIYFGHVYPDVPEGTHVQAGERIAHTGAPGGGGAPDGWLEIGWWRNGPTGNGVAMHDALINAEPHKEALFDAQGVPPAPQQEVSMTRKGLDFTASGYPGAAWMAAHGYSFGISYVSWGTRWKDMTRGMVDDMAAHGIDIVTNFEGESAPTGGFGEGYQAGQRVAAARAMLGMPKGRPCLFSFDFDVQEDSWPSLDAYLRGARNGDPLGGLPGCYSNGSYLLHAGQANLIGVAWLSGSTGWSGYDAALASGRMSIIQAIGPPNYDFDTAHVADFGQWRPGQRGPARQSSVHPDLKEVFDMADPELTVSLLYDTELWREPDPTGMRTYVRWLNEHGNTPQAVSAVRTAILNSAEGKECSAIRWALKRLGPDGMARVVADKDGAADAAKP